MQARSLRRLATRDQQRPPHRRIGGIRRATAVSFQTTLSHGIGRAAADRKGQERERQKGVGDPDRVLPLLRLPAPGRQFGGEHPARPLRATPRRSDLASRGDGLLRGLPWGPPTIFQTAERTLPRSRRGRGPPHRAARDVISTCRTCATPGRFHPSGLRTERTIRRLHGRQTPDEYRVAVPGQPVARDAMRGA